MCVGGGGEAHVRAERENANVQKLRFSSLLLIIISISLHSRVSVISLSPFIVES